MMHFFTQWVVFFFVVILFNSCGGLETRPAQYALEATPEVTQQYKIANDYYLQGQLQQAEPRFRALIKDYPYNLYSDWAQYRLGEIEFRRQQYDKARVWFDKAGRGKYHPQVTPLAFYRSAVASYYLKDNKRVLKTLSQVPWASMTADLQVRAASLEVAAALSEGRREQEIHGYLTLLDAYEFESAFESPSEEHWNISKLTAYERTRHWVDEETEEPKLVDTLLEQFPKGVSGGYVLWKTVRMAYKSGDLDRARILLSQFSQSYPKNEYYAGSQILQKELNMRSSDFKIPIGVILPLSGKFKVYGEAALHGIECAAGIYKPCRNSLNVQLIIKDSEGDPHEVQRAVRELAEQKVLGIVGPLSQLTVAAAAEEAQKQGIPMITLSQKQGVPEIGSYIFRNFLTIPDQVFTVVNHVCSNSEKKHFAILYPDSSLGKEYYEYYKTAVDGCKGKITAEAKYDPQTTDFKDAIRRLKFSLSEHLKGEGLGFDFLYIPDSYRHAASIIKDLPFLNIEGVQLLGSAGWSHPGLTQELKDHVQGAIFVAGFFTESQNAPTQNFNDDFYRAFSFNPTFLEAYGFDSMRLIINRLTEKKLTSREGLRKALSEVHDYPGVTGLISFDSEGDAKRRLFILTVNGETIKEVY